MPERIDSERTDSIGPAEPVASPCRTRLFVSEPLAMAAMLEVGVTQSHYLRHVLRLPPGAMVAVFNGKDGEWRAAIEGYSKTGCRLRPLNLLRPQPASPHQAPWLLFAPIKRSCLDFMVEKATELGVTRLLPVLTRHTDIARINLERLSAIVIEAAEQCQRLTVPEVAPAQSLAAVLSGWQATGMPLLVCAEFGPVRPIATVAANMAAGPVGILVGPEGGFSEAELDELVHHPLVVAVGLGPRVLRAETAALAALACWQAVRGDWTADGGTEIRPPFRG